MGRGSSVRTCRSCSSRTAGRSTIIDNLSRASARTFAAGARSTRSTSVARGEPRSSQDGQVRRARASRGADGCAAERRRPAVRRERQRPRLAEHSRGGAQQRSREDARRVFARRAARSTAITPRRRTSRRLPKDPGFAVRDHEARRRVLPRRTTRAFTGSTRSRSASAMCTDRGRIHTARPASSRSSADACCRIVR